MRGGSTSLRGSMLLAGAVASCALVLQCGGFGVSDGVGQPADAAPDIDAPEAADAADGGELPLDAGADGAAARWCATVVDASFCADFDGVTVEEGWNGNVPQGGKVELDTADSVSPPASMRSTTFATDAGPTSASLAKIIGGPPKSVQLRFKMRVPKAHPPTYAQFATIRFGGNLWQFSIGVDAMGSFVLESPLSAIDGGSNVRHALDVAIDAGQWVDMNFEVTPGKLIRIQVDSKLAFLAAQNIADASVPSTVVYVGISFADISPGDWVIHYDNVRLDVAQ